MNKLTDEEISALKQISENEMNLYKGIKKLLGQNERLEKKIESIESRLNAIEANISNDNAQLSGNIQDVKNTIDILNKENKKKTKTFVDMAGDVQGIVDKKIAELKSDVQQILQKL